MDNGVTLSKSEISDNKQSEQLELEMSVNVAYGPLYPRKNVH